MSMTPEEIDRIYIQEHGMTKGAFSVGLQGSLTHRSSVEEWAEGDPVQVWLEGKDAGEKSTVCIAYESGRWWHYKKADDGDPRARSRAWVFLLCFNFFGILTTKPPGLFWVVRAKP